MFRTATTIGVMKKKLTLQDVVIRLDEMAVILNQVITVVNEGFATSWRRMDAMDQKIELLDKKIESMDGRIELNPYWRQKRLRLFVSPPRLPVLPFLLSHPR